MEYTAEFDSTTKIYTVYVAGELHSPRDSYKLQQAAIELYTKHECNTFLFNLTQVKIISNTLSAYDTANIKGETAVKLRRLKVAFLYSTLTRHERFFETAAVNRGFSIKVFDNRDEAIKWLHP